MNANLGQDFNPFYATGLFLTTCGFLMFSEGIEREESWCGLKDVFEWRQNLALNLWI